MVQLQQMEVKREIESPSFDYSQGSCDEHLLLTLHDVYSHVWKEQDTMNCQQSSVEVCVQGSRSN